MAKIYLCEGIEGAVPFIIDRSAKPIVESLPSGGSIHRYPGRLSICDHVNGNNRRYRKPIWEKNLAEGSPLKKLIAQNKAFGLLEHPADGKVTLESPISHQVTKAELCESKDSSGKSVWEVVGELSIYNPNLNKDSAKLLSLIEGGYNPDVSTRGYGSLTTAPDGVDDVQDDYVCEGVDCVIKPSFGDPGREARMRVHPTAESKKAGKDDKVLTENDQAAFTSGSGRGVNIWKVYSHLSRDQFKKPWNSLSEEEAEKVVSAADKLSQAELQQLDAKPLPQTPINNVKETQAAKPQPKSTMTINEIKGRIATLKSIDPGKLTPQVFAESIAEAENIHRDVAKFVAEDATRTYEGSRADRELDQVVERWNKIVAAPAQRAVKLGENNMKLMKVIAATAKAGIGYKKKLGEALSRLNKANRLNEELTRRGQGWRALAESRKEKLGELSEHFNTSCESLDIVSARYHGDLTNLGREYCLEKFKAKITPEISKKLQEATRLRHVAAICEELEGKKPQEKKSIKETQKPSATVLAVIGKTVTEKKDDKTVDGKPIGEKKDDKTTDGKPVVTEAKVTLAGSVRDPRDINESVEMVRRLSGRPAPAAATK